MIMYISAYAYMYEMYRPYALCANGLRYALRPAIARIKIGCAPTFNQKCCLWDTKYTHQGRMRTYGIDRIRYKGNSNHYAGNLAEDARLRDSHFLIPAKHVLQNDQILFSRR